MEDYNMVAFCTEQTTAEQEHFYSIQPIGVNACVVNLTVGGKTNRVGKKSRNVGSCLAYRSFHHS